MLFQRQGFDHKLGWTHERIAKVCFAWVDDIYIYILYTFIHHYLPVKVQDGSAVMIKRDD